LTDYYSILSRAVASLEPNTAPARAAIFERARHMLVNQIRANSQRWSDAEIEAEIERFDAATDRIELEIRARSRSDTRPRQRSYETADARPEQYDPPSKRSLEKQSLGRIAAFVTAGVVGVVLIGLAVAYVLQRPASPTVKTTDASTSAPKSVERTKGNPRVDGDDLEPGIDGGSTDAGLPYYMRRQAVYYRSVYSAGMIVIDRSQRFLYLVQPQSKALRYGIGVGGECAVSAGLYRIVSKAQWPVWSPSPALLKRRSYPARMAGGPGNPLGAEALYFEHEVPAIHGTNAPKTIGQAPMIGCFRLVNNDVIDLEKRVAVGTGVVVLN
jgi:lipoprotein-anchoring transpeptidase ErfK/SrfK